MTTRHFGTWIERPLLGAQLVHEQPHRHLPGPGALLMALWRRHQQHSVKVHSDQGCNFTGHELQTFLRDHNLVSAMRRRGNCHGNAVAESFFHLLKRERIRQQVYATRNDARADMR